MRSPDCPYEVRPSIRTASSTRAKRLLDPYERGPGAPAIARWVPTNVPNGLNVGPDSESEQLARAVADTAQLPFFILEKERLGSTEVKVSVPDLERWRDRRPDLVDDGISTGHTMGETIRHLRDVGCKQQLCVGVHAVFAGDAYAELFAAGAEYVVTTTTIAHESTR